MVFPPLPQREGEEEEEEGSHSRVWVKAGLPGPRRPGLAVRASASAPASVPWPPLRPRPRRLAVLLSQRGTTDARLRPVLLSLPGQTERRLCQLLPCLLGACEGRPPRAAAMLLTLLREAAVLLSLLRKTETRLWARFLALLLSVLH